MHEALVFAALEALQPVQRLKDAIARAHAHASRIGGGSGSSRDSGSGSGGSGSDDNPPPPPLNVLHLHAEEDWAVRCALWEASDGERTACVLACCCSGIQPGSFYAAAATPALLTCAV